VPWRKPFGLGLPRALRPMHFHPPFTPGEKQMARKLYRSMWMAALAVAGLATALPAAAQFAKPEDAIKYRKAAFTVMAAHFGRVAGIANGKIPFDAKMAAENAEIATAMSKLPFAGFVPGSDKGDTKAKPEIWTEMDKVKAAATKMQDEMVKLNTAAKGGNIDTIKAAAGEVGKACKGCHDDYRKE
jgi:cytochrome c556